MNILLICYWIFFSVWVLGGIALFVYVKAETLTRRARETKQKVKELGNVTKQHSVAGAKIIAQSLMLLAPFLIPLVVTLLSYYFSS